MPQCFICGNPVAEDGVLQSVCSTKCLLGRTAYRECRKVLAPVVFLSPDVKHRMYCKILEAIQEGFMTKEGETLTEWDHLLKEDDAD